MTKRWVDATLRAARDAGVTDPDALLQAAAQAIAAARGWWTGEVAAWMPDVPDPGGLPTSVLGAIREGLLAAGERKASGAHYTPDDVAARVTEMVVRESASQVIDLSCGAGAFVLAAVRAGCDEVIGLDDDPLALRAAHHALWLESRGDPAQLPRVDLQQLDGLSDAAAARIADCDAVIGNPPYLFGEQRNTAGTDLARFTLAAGQWDTSWLFVEHALTHLRPGGRIGLLLPESIIARDEPQRVRQFILDRVGELHVWHIGPIFDAGVSVVALVATKAASGAAGSFIYERDGLRTSVPLDTVRTRPARTFLPAAATSASPVAGSVALGDLVSISRGEEIGKRDLQPIVAGQPLAPSLVPVLAGEGIAGGSPLAQPVPTRAMPADRVAKSRDRYRAPRIVIAKTGRRLRVGIDRVGHVALQSVYNLHLLPGAPPWATLEHLATVLASDAIHAAHIEPLTSARHVFPQITQRMLLAIRVPRGSAG
ncbi:MAG: class I SAM-dependent DNA methyltransferase [Planctomycetota bacterium]